MGVLDLKYNTGDGMSKVRKFRGSQPLHPIENRFTVKGVDLFRKEESVSSITAVGVEDERGVFI